MLWEGYNKANPFKNDDSYSDEVLTLSKWVKEPPLLYNEVQERDLYTMTPETKDHMMKMRGYDNKLSMPSAREQEDEDEYVLYFMLSRVLHSSRA